MPEFSQLRSLIVPMPSFQKARADYSVEQGKLADYVLAGHGRAEGEYLERAINSRTYFFDMAAERQFIYLTPYSAHGNVYLPLMAVAADYRGVDRPTVNVSVLLYSLHQMGIGCLSYRFDSPNRTYGDHDYFHMQFDWGPDTGTVGRPHPDALRWVSRKDPSIPLDATSPLELFVASVMSFRNTRMSRQSIFDQWRQAGLPLAALLGNMAFGRWKAPWVDGAPQGAG